MKRKNRAFCLCLLLLVSGLTGCAEKQSHTPQSVTQTAKGMETEAVIEYTIPKSLPGILINQAGYGTRTEKTAIFTGEELPETFRVYNAETKQEVYEGKIIPKGQETEEDNQIAYGSFGEVQVPGQYYIEADILGYSYTFSVDSQVYRELLCLSLKHFDEIMQGKNKLTEEEIKQNCEAVINMLLAEELHGNAFDDDMGIGASGNEIPDLIDILLAKIMLLNAQREVVLSSENMEMVSYYAAAMAKFSYTYQEYDSAFATSCLQLADMAWKYMENSGQEVERDLSFMVASELYRASGQKKYHTRIKEYGAGGEIALDSREAVYGAVTYLSTKQSVDIKLCNELMKNIMSQAEDISTCSEESGYQVHVEKNTENEDILWNMVILTVADKVISNHEYANVIENHLHYFLGCNPLAVSFVDGVGTRSFTEEEGLQSIMDGGFQESVLLIMLSEINDIEE